MVSAGFSCIVVSPDPTAHGDSVYAFARHATGRLIDSRIWLIAIDWAKRTDLLQDFPNLVLCKHLASIATPPRFITEPPSAWNIRFRNRNIWRPADKEAVYPMHSQKWSIRRVALTGIGFSENRFADRAFATYR